MKKEYWKKTIPVIVKGAHLVPDPLQQKAIVKCLKRLVKVYSEVGVDFPSSFEWVAPVIDGSLPCLTISEFQDPKGMYFRVDKTKLPFYILFKGFGSESPQNIDKTYPYAFSSRRSGKTHTVSTLEAFARGTMQRSRTVTCS